VGPFNVSLYADTTFIGKTDVSALGAGNNATVQFIWTPIGCDCEDGCSPVTYTLQAIADCDGDVPESDDLNNASTADETAYWAGYSADEPLSAVIHGTINGGLNYTTGDGAYISLSNYGGNKATHTTNYNIGQSIPSGATVALARLNVYYTWSHTGSNGVYPSMEVNITNSSDTYTVASAAEYNDRPCDSPAIGYEYPFGNYVYDITDYAKGENAITVTVKNLGPDGNMFCPAAPGIVILYEDSTKPEYEYWLMEGADLLEGGRRGGAGNLDLGECISNATFTGSVDTGRVETATLGIVSAWGGVAWGIWTSHYWFNNNYLGNGSILGGYGSHYSRTVDGISMDVGASNNAQVGANVSDVTGYTIGQDNVISFGDGGDSMMAANAFLMLEYGTEVPVPFFVYGWVNCINGGPVNDPDVMITNLNTSEVFIAETDPSSNYYQVLIGSLNVSAGDVLHFNASKGNSTEFNHTITAAEMNAGGFTQNATIECGGPAGICGDVNDDGDVDMTDVMTLWYDIADYPYVDAYTVSNAWAADVNCDGELDMTDVMTLWYDIADYPYVGAYEVNCC
jgi:hypothetical protein